MNQIDLGRWPVTIIEHGFSEASTGTPQMFVVFENEHGDQITWYSTMGMRADGSVSEKAMEFFVKDCRTMGFDPRDHGGDVTVLRPGGGVSLIGNQVAIVVEDETYNGKTIRRVKWVNPLNNRQELNPTERRDLFAKIKAAMHTGGHMDKGPRSAPPPRVDVEKREPAPARRDPAPQQRQTYVPPEHRQGIDYGAVPDDIPF